MCKYGLSVYQPEIGPLVHKDLYLRTVSIFANQIVNSISIYINAKIGRGLVFINSIDQICCWSGDVFVVAVVGWTVDTDNC